jgi:hypothetical protein
MLEQAVKEIAGKKIESELKEGRRHHNLLRVGCWYVLPFGKPPLENRAIREEMILDEFEDFPLIRNGLLEHVWMGGGHGEGKEDLG